MKKNILLIILSFFLLLSCYTDLDEINSENKFIKIIDIPNIHNGKTLNIRLYNNENVNYSYHNRTVCIYGNNTILNDSVNISLMYSNESNTIQTNWSGFGSFNISFRIPFGQGNYAYLDNTNSEEFRYTNGKFNFISDYSIISFNDFTYIGY